MRRAKIDAGRGPLGALPTAEREELARLRKQVRRGDCLVRGDNPTPTSLTFTRSAGLDAGSGCGDSEISSLPWQRLDFGARARVQRFVRTVTSTSLPVTIAPVDTTRTLVFASGQQGSGAGTGETNYSGGSGGRLGVGNARFVLTNSTTVTITRGDSSGDGVFTFYVVEIDP